MTSFTPQAGQQGAIPSRDSRQVEIEKKIIRNPKSFRAMALQTMQL
jgi:hypothetical protein